MRKVLKAALIGSVLAVVLLPLLVGNVFLVLAHFRETLSRREAAPPAGRFVKAEDVEIFVQELGPPEGPPVLFIHGMGAWSELWRETMRPAALAGYRCLAIDVPPFGYSQRPADASYGRRSQAKRILGVLDALGVTSAVLVGHSFGAGPTVEAAMMAPERVSRLVLADAALGLGAPATAASPVASGVLGVPLLRQALIASTAGNPWLTRRLLLKFVAKPEAVTDARVTLLQQPMAVRGSARALSDWLRAFLTTNDPAMSADRANYAALTMPTLLIWGDADTVTPLSQGEELARLIRGATLQRMPGVGHMPQIEDPPAFQRSLLAFLGSAKSK
ncbi:MAG: alpha/beta hydrolase [Elusimicrobia bacterium]|nr:alpha/beta hydrolase [Elusimicrobiota bacterium]